MEKKDNNKKTEQAGKTIRLWHGIRDYLLTGVCVWIALVVVLQLWRADLSKYPLQYSMGDDMTAAMTIKTMQEEGWMFHNSLLGAPSSDGVLFLDSTTGELLLNVIEKLMITVTGNWVLTLNLFYLSGYFFCAWTALFVLKRLDCSRFVAILGALIYSFYTYHFYRGIGHLFLSEYFMVPLMVYYVICFMRQKQVWEIKERKLLTGKNIGHVLCFVCMATTGVYYAYFFCFFLCVSIFYKLVNRVSWKKCIQEVFGIGIVCVSLLCTLLPYVLYWKKYGRNVQAIERNLVGIEVYSMKLNQLILPIQGHRIGKLASIRDFYNQYPLINENATVSLGMIMSIGFLIMLFSVFWIHRMKEQQLISKLVVLNYAALLIGTIGSFSSIIGGFFNMIRCYNRICVFIAMFSVLTVCILLDYGIKHMPFFQKWRIAEIILVTLLMIFGIWDQTAAWMIPNYDGIQNEFDSDALFVDQIETENPNGIIFQMPCVVYPEQGPVNGMTDYSHLKGYLHSDSLRWSYCAVKGRETANWQQEVSSLPLEEQLDRLKDAGFTGIYIDSAAYTTEELTDLRTELEQQIGPVDVVSQNGRLLYYHMESGTY